MKAQLMWLTIGVCGALVLTGCPAEENNDSPKTNNTKNNTKVDMTDMPDMADMSDDMQDMTERDMSGELAKCQLLTFAPRTMPNDGNAKEVKAIIECDPETGQVPAEVDYVVKRGNQELKGKMTLNRRELKEELLASYEVKFTDITPPKEEGQSLGLEMVKVESLLGSWNMPLRWHLPTDEVAKQQTRPAQMLLPKGFATRGIGAQLKATAAGHVLIGAMVRDTRDHIDLFVQQVSLEVTGGQNITEASVNIDLQDLAVQDFAVHRTDSGQLHVVWWGYNSSTQSFEGKILELDKDGKLLKERKLNASAGGPKLTRILDSMIAVRGKKGAQSVSVDVIALTDKNTITAISLFAGGTDDIKTLDTSDAVGGVSGAQMKPGLLRAIRSRNDADADTEKATSYAVLNPGTKTLTILPVDKSTRGIVAQLNLDFEALEMFVGPTGDGSTAFVLVHGKDNQRALFKTGLAGAAGTLNPIEMPDNVDIRPPRQQMGEYVPDFNFYTGAGQLAARQINGQTTMLGRWPWNWRDKLKVAQQQAQGRWPWDWRERQGLYDQASMVVQWGPRDQLASVHPTMADEGTLPTTPGSVISTGLSQDGTSLVLGSAKLDASKCVDRRDCAVNIGTSSQGVGLSLLPGIKGPTYAIDKYGDILIDGVPLEFDLIGPPIIFGTGSAFRTDTTKGTSLAIAPIVHKTNKQVTHAMWSIDENGMPSQPVPIWFNFGDKYKDLDIDFSSPLKAGLVTPEDVAALGIKVMVTIGVLPKSDDRAQTHKALTFSFRYDRGIQAIVDGKVAEIGVDPGSVFIDNVNDDPALSKEVFLPAAISLNPSDEDAQNFGFLEITRGLVRSEGKTTFTSIPIEGMALNQPILVRNNDKGELVIYGGTGDVDIYKPLAVIGPKEVLLNIGFKLGDGTPQIYTMNYADFTGRIRRVRIKKRRVGSGFSLSEGDTVEMQTIAMDNPIFTAQSGPSNNVIHSKSVDVNGDGLEDDVIFGVANEKGNVMVRFADGMGGHLPDAWFSVGEPTVFYVPKASENGDIMTSQRTVLPKECRPNGRLLFKL